MDLNLKEILAKYMLGLFPPNDLPMLGIQALEEGYDSPSLRQLAGLDKPDSEEAKRLFLRAMGELNTVVPSMPDAGLIVAQSIARRVLDHKIEPYEGAREIWDKVYVPLPELKQLRPFVGLASEYEDDVRHREEYSRRIVEKCAMLVRDAEA